MSIQIYDQSRPKGFLIMLIIMICIWWVGSTEIQSGWMEISQSNSINHWLQKNGNILGKVLFLFLVAVQGFFISLLCYENELLPKWSMLPGIIYSLCCLVSPKLSSISIEVIANGVVIFLFFESFKIERLGTITKAVFNQSLIIGLLSVLNQSFLFILPLCWIPLIIKRQFILREWLIPFVGVLTVWVYHLGFIFIQNNVFNVPEIKLNTVHFQLDIEQMGNSTPLIATLYLYLGILSFLGCFTFFSGFIKHSNRILKNQYILLTSFIFVFIFSLVLLLFDLGNTPHFLLFPFLAYFSAVQILSIKRNWLKSFTFYTFVLLVLLNVYLERIF